MSDQSTLSGVPIEKWIEQPRKTKSDGTQDFDSFAFVLRNSEDASKIPIRHEVLLEE